MIPVMRDSRFVWRRAIRWQHNDPRSTTILQSTMPISQGYNNLVMKWRRWKEVQVDNAIELSSTSNSFLEQRAEIDRETRKGKREIRKQNNLSMNREILNLPTKICTIDDSRVTFLLLDVCRHEALIKCWFRKSLSAITSELLVAWRRQQPLDS